MLPATLFTVTLLVSGCSKYVPSTENGSTNSTISYQTRIQPLIENYCIECHDATSDIMLTDYDHVVTIAKSGQLHGSLSGNSQYQQMPRNYVMNESEKALILNWIEQGFPE